ncbi:MAG: hypothetical protein ABEJ31_01545 [Haloarculaceae archaeon]
MAVTLGPDALAPYARVSLFNSPYPAHDRGCAVDLYPDAGGAAPSPVAGRVRDVRSVDAPAKPYAEPRDHLVLIETDEYVVRVLHVDPAVEPGDAVARGDSLGRLLRSGFFAPWVDGHLHVGVREPGANHVRASGSLPLRLAVDLEPLRWDGLGTVVATGETWARLDAPVHPDPGGAFAGIAAGGGLLDGGLPHYDGGGILGGAIDDGGGERPISLLGERVGTARGRTVEWADVTVRANGRPLTGLSLFLAREQWGLKLVCPDHGFAVGDDVTVTVERS